MRIKSVSKYMKWLKSLFSGCCFEPHLHLDEFKEGDIDLNVMISCQEEPLAAVIASAHIKQEPPSSARPSYHIPEWISVAG